MTDRLADEQIAEIEARPDFLMKAARYFRNRPTNGEDLAHWSNVYNSENCEKTATDIRALLDEVKRLRSAADSADMSGAAIMVCRKMLKDELGIHHAFFDDCVAHAIAMVKEGKTDD